MKILSLDTTNNSASVALSHNKKVLAYLEEIRPSMQAETILPMLENILKITGVSYQDIDYLAVTNGPGSFTGIRVGLAVAKGILLGTNIKGITLSNFEYSYFRATMQVKNYDRIYVILNAYRTQLYIQDFDQYGNSGTPSLVNYEVAIDILKQGRGNIICIGNGVEYIYSQINNISNVLILPRFSKIKAWVICKYIAQKLSKNQYMNNQIEPLYIRLPDAKVPL